jgi:FHA domain-containing protein
MDCTTGIADFGLRIKERSSQPPRGGRGGTPLQSAIRNPQSAIPKVSLPGGQQEGMEEATMIHLLITLGDDRREVVIDQPTLTIGRSSENDVPVSEPRLSRHHALIEGDELGFVVKDLDSANGTWLNGRRVSSDRLLQGDEIRVGRALILVLSLRSPAAMASHKVPSV